MSIRNSIGKLNPEAMKEKLGKTESLLISEGMTVRIGNRLVKLQVSSEETIPDEDLKRDYQMALDQYKKEMAEMYEAYTESMAYTLREKSRTYEEAIAKLQSTVRNKATLPMVLEHQAEAGISVALDDRTKYPVWYFKGVYAPKYVNGKVIDPTFAKKLMTPVVIKIVCDNGYKVSKMIVTQIIGNRKFSHYHSFSGDTRDCWGSFSFQGTVCDDADKAIKLGRDAIVVLETINELSIAQRSPAGLPRFSTVIKYILDEDAPTEEKKTANKAVNTRSGFGADINSAIPNIWTT